jgi:formate dehydrogenase iron-sulfur subunit
VRWIYVTSDRRSFAVKKHFEDVKPRTTEGLRQILKPLTIYGGAALVGALTVLGFAAWRRSRIEEKKEGSSKE